MDSNENHKGTEIDTFQRAFAIRAESILSGSEGTAINRSRFIYGRCRRALANRGKIDIFHRLWILVLWDESFLMAFSADEIVAGIEQVEFVFAKFESRRKWACV